MEDPSSPRSPVAYPPDVMTRRRRNPRARRERRSTEPHPPGEQAPREGVRQATRATQPVGREEAALERTPLAVDWPQDWPTDPPTALDWPTDSCAGGTRGLDVPPQPSSALRKVASGLRNRRVDFWSV